MKLSESEKYELTELQIILANLWANENVDCRSDVYWFMDRITILLLKEARIGA